jgi:hypothetical protein
MMNENQVSLLDREPVAVTSALFAVIQAGITLMTVFGLVTLTPEQLAAILGFVTVLFALYNSVVVRGKVTPVADPRDDQGQSLVSRSPV